MKKEIKYIFSVLLICAFSLRLNLCLAEEIKHKCLKAAEVLFDYKRAKLDQQQGNYYAAAFNVGFDFDIKQALKKIHLEPRGLAEFQLEPFISDVIRPRKNVEAGNAFNLKIGILPESAEFQPYGKLGVGMLFMSEHLKEQSTQFNFFEQGGLGMHYFFTDSIGLTAECLYRHTSNAGMREPNHGFNSFLYSAGASYKF